MCGNISKLAIFVKPRLAWLVSKLVSLRNKLRSIRLVWVTVVALQILLNDKYKLESLQGDGSRTRQESPQTAGCKARACNFCFR